MVTARSFRNEKKIEATRPFGYDDYESFLHCFQTIKLDGTNPAMIMDFYVSPPSVTDGVTNWVSWRLNAKLAHLSFEILTIEAYN